MLFRTTFANEQLNHLRDQQSLRWKISEDTSLSFNIRIWFDHHTKRSASLLYNGRHSVLPWASTRQGLLKYFPLKQILSKEMYVLF